MPANRCQETRSRVFNRLITTDRGFCRGKCIAIILGAGCNIGAIPNCRMPMWSELLKMISSEPGKIDHTRYLETAGRVEAEFLERSRKKVCEQFSRLGLIMAEDAIDATVRPDVSQRIARYVRLALKRGIKNPGGPVVPNSTMDCLISACVNRIQENLRTIVVTYNYDDLFECKLLDRLRIENIPHGDEIVRSASGMLPDATELICSGKNGPSVDIFYVHGKIPLFGGDANDISDRIILSQQSYDILSRNHLEFANQVQYVVQSGIPIVSIGFSLDDINFCRLRTDLHSNYRHLPPFYSLQYCGSKDCVTCNSDVRKKMDARLRHIEMLKIQALPMPSNDLTNCFNAIFN